LRVLMPDEANDVRLNLENIVTSEGSPGLTENQVLGAVLARGYATKNPRCQVRIRAHLHELRRAGLRQEAVQSVLRIAAVINATAQAMNLDDGSYN
jgi:hypothetical protein